MAPVPGSTPGMCCCVVTWGLGSPGPTSVGPCVRLSNEPASRSGERSAESSKGKEPQESWRFGDGSSHAFELQYPEALAGLDVKPPKGEGGGAVNQSGRQVEREQALEGQTPRRARRPEPLVVSASARTRHGMKALKSAGRTRSPPGRLSAAGNARRARAPRGAPIVTRGIP